MSSIRILADDLTGALDTAAAFAGNVPVFIDRPPVTAEASRHALSVVATPTRDVAPATLPEFLSPTRDWLCAGTLAFKKLDSLLRGNSFAEIVWLYRNAGFARVVFAPAFPAQGRVTQADRQWVVRPEAGREAVAVPLRAAFTEHGLSVSEMPEDGADVWLPTAVSDDDLDRIVATGVALAGDSLWAGSAGLGNAWARRQGLSADVGRAVPLAHDDGPTLFVSASFQASFREQWARLCAANPGASVTVGGDAPGVSRAIAAVRAGARDAWLVLASAEWVSDAEAARRLADNAARLVAELPRPAQLVVVGGDTLLALCRASGAVGLLSHPSLRPGWGCARLMGGAWDGIPCYSRSGAFGTADDLVALFGALGNPVRRSPSVASSF